MICLERILKVETFLPSRLLHVILQYIHAIPKRLYLRKSKKNNSFKQTVGSLEFKMKIFDPEIVDAYSQREERTYVNQ